MIVIEKALEIVLSESHNYGAEHIPLLKCVGHILAEDIITDRDAPPFDRVMMDGIAIRLGELSNSPEDHYTIQGIQAAGTPQMTLKDNKSCLEVMTGSILPKNTDTVIPYEALRIENSSVFILNKTILQRHIHYKGSDCRAGKLVLPKVKKINTADVGILATIGKALVRVAKRPKVAIISTGNELVDVHENPKKHQIRSSNSYTLFAALTREGLAPTLFHFPDNRVGLHQGLSELIIEYDVLLLSGGVSKGKFDLVPEVLNTIGVEKLFHGVAQKPGKPFWFGKHRSTQTKVFAFPGNPLSTFVSYHYYFRQWLYLSMGCPLPLPVKPLAQSLPGNKSLSQFIPVKLCPLTDGASPLTNNGSGDLFVLAQSDGFILLPPSVAAFKEGVHFPFLGF